MSEVKAVAVLTTFGDLPRMYGLVPVVLNQIRTLVDKGYEVGFYVQDGFQSHPDVGDVPPGCELHPRVPFLHLYDYQLGTEEQKHDIGPKGKRTGDGHNQVKTNFKKQVKKIEKSLESWLMEYPTVITHDILFQTWFVPHNQAVRNIGEKYPDIRWIHWLHSGPSPPPADLHYPHTLRYRDMPNSIFVSPNDTMREKFAEMYDVPIKKIKTVYHTYDPFHFEDMHELSKKMAERHKLIDCDGMVVWPTRMDAPHPKGMYNAIRLVAMMNRMKDIKFVFLNSWSDSPKAKNNIESLKKEAEAWGLPKENLIFSSEMGRQWEEGVPREVVRDMFHLGDMFIQPSLTETFSLIMLEGGGTKNMCIMNESLDVFRELCEDRVDYIRTGSEWGGIKVTEHYWGPERNCPECGTLSDVSEDAKTFICNECKTERPAVENPRAYWTEKAHSLLARLGYVDYHCEHCGEKLGKIGAYNPLRQHRHILKYFSKDWVWKNQLESLIKGDW